MVSTVAAAAPVLTIEPHTAHLPPSGPEPFVPYPYQMEAVTKICEEVAAGRRRTLFVLPTGCGKTLPLALLAGEFGFPFVILTHRRELLDQLHRTMIRAHPGVSVGIEQGSQTLRGDEAICLASIPTLIKTPTRLARVLARRWTAVAVDEVHHAPAPSWRHVLHSLRCFAEDGPPLIGCTATPTRGDRIGLGTIFESIAYQRSLRDMIVEGWLSVIRAYTITTTTNLDGVRTENGDFVDGDLGSRVNTRERNALVVESYRRLGQNRRALVFAATIKHANALALSFRNAGYQAAHYASDIAEHERTGILEAFKRDQIHILVSVATLVEGYDDPPLSLLILARPTKSPLLYAQVIGRGTRRANGKSDCLVLDLVDVCSQHQIQSVATLFGLDHPLRFRGEPVVNTIDQIDVALARNIGLSLNDFVAAEDVLRAAAQAELAATPIALILDLPDEIKQTNLLWHKLSDSKYLIDAGADTYLHIVANALGRWEIRTMPDATLIVTLPSLPEAFQAAELHLKHLNFRQYRLNLRNAPWRDNPPTPAQEKTLRRHNLWHETLSRGDASRLIGNLRITHVQYPPETTPATPRQETVLKAIGRWEDGMTKATASAALTAYGNEPADDRQRQILEGFDCWRDGMTRTEANAAIAAAKKQGPQSQPTA